jgi:hypothetical protein
MTQKRTLILASVSDEGVIRGLMHMHWSELVQGSRSSTERLRLSVTPTAKHSTGRSKVQGDPRNFGSLHPSGDNTVLWHKTPKRERTRTRVGKDVVASSKGVRSTKITDTCCGPLPS